MIRFLIAGLGGLWLAGIDPAAAQDLEAGQKVAHTCQTCHGLDGYAKLPMAPHIGGEPASYIEKQLVAFKTGTRSQEMMTVVAGGLSEQQIADVAAWYASQSASAEIPPSVDESEAPPQCVPCHGADGIALLEEAPNLAGEGSIYIETQLKAFRSGKRVNDIMNTIAAELTDDEIRAAANWYSAIDLEINKAD